MLASVCNQHQGQDLNENGLKLSEDTTLSIAELTCHEPGCPPVETIITACKKDGEQKNWRIAKPISEIKEADINEMIVEF